jgi:hypothetical protein
VNISQGGRWYTEQRWTKSAEINEAYLHEGNVERRKKSDEAWMAKKSP